MGLIFRDAIKIASDFQILGYYGYDDNKSVNLVGKNSQNHLTFLSDFNTNNNTFKDKKSFNLNLGSIVNVITQPFFKNETCHLVVSKKDKGGFKSGIYSSTGTLKLKLPDSQAAPMLISNPSTLFPLLLIQENDSINFYEIQEREITRYKNFSIKEKFSKAHSSSFLDLTGNFTPDLALILQNNNNKYLKIMSMNSESINELQEIGLPLETGPLLFIDSKGRGTFDLAYVSIEENISYLNVHFNNNIPDIKIMSGSQFIDHFEKHLAQKIFNPEPDIKLDLTEKFGGQAIIADDDSMPTGIFASDFQVRGAHDVIVRMQINGVSYQKPLQISEDNKVIVPHYSEILDKYKNAMYISSSDIRDKGKEDMVINHVENGELILTSSSPREVSSFSKINILVSMKYFEKALHVFGASILVVYNAGSKIIKGTQLYNTSYASLLHPGFYTGLGATNFFVSYALIKSNLENKSVSYYKADSVIVPNTYVIFQLQDDNTWLLQSFFPFSQYVKVSIALFIIIVMNAIVLIAFLIKEKKAIMKLQDDKKLKSVFIVL